MGIRGRTNCRGWMAWYVANWTHKGSFRDVNESRWMLGHCDRKYGFRGRLWTGLKTANFHTTGGNDEEQMMKNDHYSVGMPPGLFNRFDVIIAPVTPSVYSKKQNLHSHLADRGVSCEIVAVISEEWSRKYSRFDISRKNMFCI